MPRVKGIKQNVKRVFNIQKTTLLLSSLQIFYINNRDYLETINEIINNKRLIKLAMIDYVVTIYSKKNKSFIELEDDRYYINDQYKNQLKSYTKRHFDPFKRHEKITFQYAKIEFQTTVGQLNFLKWAIQNKVIQYIENNFTDIDNAMCKHLEEKKRKGEEKKENQRLVKELKTLNLNKNIKC